MAFQVSPGVQVREIDLTNIVPAVASTSAGFAGYFEWGPVEEVVTVSNSQELVEYFGEPGSSQATAEDFYIADSFLKYGSSLRLTRINTSGLSSSNASGGVTTVKNEDDYEVNVKDGSLFATVGIWIAKYAGSRGNGIGVDICGSSTAFSDTTFTTVNGGGNPVARGARDVDLTDATGVTTNSIIQFSNHTTKYRVISVAGNSLVIDQIGAPAGTGLSQSVPDGTNVTLYWQFYDLFSKAPGTSPSSSLAGAGDDEVHIVVYDADGSITGLKNTVLEKYEAVSLASDAKDSVGQSNFYKSVIERESVWVWWSGHSTSLQASATIDVSHNDSIAVPFLRPSSIISNTLSNGSNGNIPTAGEIYGTWETQFNNEAVDISFLIAGSTRTDDGAGNPQDLLSDWTAIINEGIRICENRRDCLLVASPQPGDVINVASESSQALNVVGTVNTATSSSYVVFDSTWVYQYDRYNDRYIWVPANGHTAGIMVRTDVQRDPWFSPAGLSRGQYLGIVKTAFNPGKASRDDLYRARVNPVTTFPGQGTVLYGDKTGLTIPSAFDRINVRRLFIVLEKAIAIAAKAQLFEFNDAFTRAQFRAAVEPFLRDVKNRRGLIDFAVLCDETNNTDSVIDRNEFVCSIFIKPSRSINFITLNFVAARTGVDFEEIYSAV